jgi:peptidoglycan biosynthesis protein MviN/MurJ (putative lipid II flippase)
MRAAREKLTDVTVECELTIPYLSVLDLHEKIGAHLNYQRSFTYPTIT